MTPATSSLLERTSKATLWRILRWSLITNAWACCLLLLALIVVGF